MELPENYDPAEDPNKRMVKHRDGTITYVHVGARKRRLKSGIGPASQELLTELVRDTGLPVPDEISHSARKDAQAAGAKLYWSYEGCKHHGRPMLRRSVDGLCYVCVHNASVDRKEETKRRKLLDRLCVDEMETMATLAQKRGHTVYWPGTPCKRGHVAERFTVNGGCKQCHEEGRGKTYTPPLRTRPVPKAWTEIPDWPAPETSKHAYTITSSESKTTQQLLDELTGLAPPKA